MISYEAFAKTLEHQPTEEQREVIVSEDQAIAVIAGAGSGKTATMAQRIVWHIVNGNVRPDEVLGLTFTTKAAGELAERVEAQLAHAARSGLMPRADAEQVTADSGQHKGEESELEESDAVAGHTHDEMAQPTISTYNSFAASIAASYSMLIGEDPRARLITDAERWQIMRDIVSSLDTESQEYADLKGWVANTVVDRALTLAGELISNGVTTRELREVLTEERDAVQKVKDAKVARGTHTDASRATQTEPGRALGAINKRLALCTLIDSYLAYKKEHSVIEFADQVDRANRILKAVPDQVGELVGHYKLILLDEYQDTSSQQAEFLYNAFSDAWSVCAVGDPNQAIYSWRGASAAALSDFMDRFRVAKNLTLSTAFRNGSQILDAANALTQGKLSYPSMTVKKLTPRPGAGDGDVRHIHRTFCDDSYAAMADQFAGLFDDARVEISQRIERGETDPAKLTFPTAVVLCRKRSYIELTAQALENRGVPFEIVGGEALIEKPEVRLLRSFLGLVAVPDRNDLLVPIFTHFAMGTKDLRALGEFAKTLARRARKEHSARQEQAADRESNPARVEIDIRPSLVEAIDSLASAPEGMSDAGYARLKHISSLLRGIRERAHLSVPDLITHTIDALDLPFYARSRRDGGARVEGALGAFVRMAAQYVSDNPRASLKGFVEWIDAVEEHENTGEGEVSGDAQFLMTEEVVPESGVVQIMTIHGAKGLEWDIVAVPDMKYKGFDAHSPDSAWQLNASALPFPLRADRAHLPYFSFADRIPAYASVTPHDKAPILEEFYRYLSGPLRAHYAAEQRRLAYVAVTRPRDTLIVCSYDLVDETKAARALEDLARRVDSELAEGPIDFATMPQNTFIMDMSEVLNPDPNNDPVLVGGDLERLKLEAEEDEGGVWAEIFDPATKRWPVDIDRRLDRSASPPTRQLAADDVSRIVARWRDEAQALIHEANASTTPGVLSRDYLTASDVVKLAADPESFVRDQRRPIPQRPSRAARTGTFVHEAIAHHYDAPLTLDVDSVADPEEMPIDSASELTDAVRERLLDRFHSSPYAACPKISIEEGVDIELGGMPIRCVIDAVLDTSGLEGHPPVTIIDWKTGRRPHPDQLESRQYQLALYRLAWSTAKGMPLEDIGAAFYYLGENEPEMRELRAPVMTGEHIARHIADQLAEGAELSSRLSSPDPTSSE